MVTALVFVTGLPVIVPGLRLGTKFVIVRDRKTPALVSRPFSITGFVVSCADDAPFLDFFGLFVAFGLFIVVGQHFRCPGLECGRHVRYIWTLCFGFDEGAHHCRRHKPSLDTCLENWLGVYRIK